MWKFYILSLACLFTVLIKVNAQQDKLLTHFIYDKMSVNPGETGMYEGVSATSVYRNQWDKVNGAPNSVIFNLEGNMNQYFPGGLGISFFHDAIGFNRQNNVLLNYSYPLALGSAGTLGIGVGFGMINFGMSPQWVPPSDATDPLLPVGFSATNLDMNAGLYWKGTDDYYVGISATHLNEALIKKSVTTTFGNIDQKYQTTRHYYVMAGKKLKDIASGDLDIQALLRTDMIKYSADLNIRYIWNNKLYGGLTYRTVDAVCVMLGWLPFNNFTIGYSYDLTTNKLAKVSRGSHEILLKYLFLPPRKTMKYYKHPKWL